MCSIQFECCPSTTVTLGPTKNSLIILSLYLSTVFQSFRAGEKGYYVTRDAIHLFFVCMQMFLTAVIKDEDASDDSLQSDSSFLLRNGMMTDTTSS